MKKLSKLFSFAIIFLSSFFVIGCKDNKSTISFDKLKEIVGQEKVIEDWQGLNITTISASGNKSFKSNKHKDDNVDKVDFIHEKGDDKVYCDDNVRYYTEDDRNFIDEEEFNYSD